MTTKTATRPTTATFGTGDTALVSATLAEQTRRLQNMSTNLAHSPVNDTRFDDLLQLAQQLGDQAGRGKDTRAKFFIALTDASYGNVIDMVESKHGPDKDDAALMWERYAAAQSGATVFDHKASNVRKEVACVRTMIKVGQWSKGGPGEPVQAMNKLLSLRQGFRKKPGGKKLEDAANMLLKWARIQYKRDTLIPDDELESLCFKKTNDTKTSEEVLVGIRNSLQQLFVGKAQHGTAQDNSKKVEGALNCLNQRIKEIAKSKNANPGVDDSADAAGATASATPPDTAAVTQSAA